jgi:hypothetical protein
LLSLYTAPNSPISRLCYPQSVVGINLKTAGFILPRTLLDRANEVIE